MTVEADQPKSGLMWMCRLCTTSLVAFGVEGKGYCRECWEAIEKFGPVTRSANLTIDQLAFIDGKLCYRYEDSSPGIWHPVLGVSSADSVGGEKIWSIAEFERLEAANTMLAEERDAFKAARDAAEVKCNNMRARIANQADLIRDLTDKQAKTMREILKLAER